jgi:hypothetical protein
MSADLPPTVERLTPEHFTGEPFGNRFRREAFRLELRDYYDSPVSRQALARFLAGEPVAQEPREHWLRMVRAVTGEGRTVARVHVIGELTDYLRYELACYDQNAAAGERIAILPAGRAASLDLPADDFWLFDGTTAAVMRYSPEGKLQHADLITDPDFTAACRRWRDVAMANAIALTDYSTGRAA